MLHTLFSNFHVNGFFYVEQHKSKMVECL
jgi:hypothetical protein